MVKNGTIAYVEKLPECDICKYTGTQSEKDSPAKAEYDFRTKAGSWAYGCEPHFKSERMHETLGVGKGQKLEVRG